MKTLERASRMLEHEIVQATAGTRDSGTWARRSAGAGALVWAGMAVAARLGWVTIGGIELMFLFAPLVIVPLGMELVREMVASDWAFEIARRLQPAGAAFAVAALCLPPGRQAALFAGPWAIICGLMAWSGVTALGRIALHGRARSSGTLRLGPVRVVETVVGIARVDLAIGAAWLVASRLGIRPMGIQEPIGLLTAVHFHFAGFATAMIAAATLRFAGPSRAWLRRLVVTVAVLPMAVAAGFVISPAMKMVAAGLFSLCVAALAVGLRSVAKGVRDSAARVLLQVSAGSVFAGMILAVAYVVADFRGSSAVTIPQMVRTHGILNAVGFCLPGLLAWLVEGSRDGSEFLR